MREPEAIDRYGRPVRVGTLVRVVAIAPRLKESLSPEEWERVQEMLGNTFSVYEIDAWGGAWVEKVWRQPGDQEVSHSVGLAAAEMEVVE